MGLSDSAPTLRRRLDALDARKNEAIANNTLSQERLRREGVEIVREADRIIRDVADHGNLALGEEGQRLLTKAETLKIKVGAEIFLLDPSRLDDQEGKTDGD